MLGRSGHWGAFGIAVSGLVASASCVQLLGDDFSIEEGTGGAEGGSGPGPTTGGHGGDGGGGGTQVGPLSCSFHHAREIASLAGTSHPQFDGRVHLVRGSHNLRAFVEHSGPNGPTVEIWSIDEGSEYVTSVPGYETAQARRVGGTTVGALVARQDPAAGHAIDYVRVDDSDDQLASVSVVPIVEGLGSIASLRARFDRVQGTSEDLALVVTHRASTTSPFLARFAYVTPSLGPAATVIFDDSSTYPNNDLNQADYEPTVLLRDSAGNNHVLFHNASEEPTLVRHFVFPDSIGGTIAPVVQESATGVPILLGMLRRSDGRYTVSYAEIGAQDAALRLGSIDEGELTTHTASIFPVAGSLAVTLFSEVAMTTTEESQIVVGPSASDSTIFRVVIAHSSATIRVNEEVALAAGVMPGDAAVQRIAAVASGPGFDAALGGDLLLVWHAEIPPDNHSRLYFAVMNCSG